MAAVWVAVFMAVFALMDISVQYVWYPTLVCAVLFLLYMLWDGYRFAGTYKMLTQGMRHIDVTLENLPKANTVLEQQYQALLQQLFIRKNQRINDMKLSHSELTEYVTTWTHQMKTPITALQLLAEDMGEETKSETLLRLFEMEQCMDRMLQYLRLESDSTDYVLKEYSLKSMVNQAVKYYARMFISKGIAVHVDIPENTMVVTDEKWMIFVLKQLISNALKYTMEGSITIRVETSADGEAAGTDTLVIEDTGIGIAAEDLPRIFERGYTGYNGRKDKKATGLGLFLTEQILGRLNHRITISSQVNVGTTVRIGILAKS
jgi:hypothetical protein